MFSLNCTLKFSRRNLRNKSPYRKLLKNRRMHLKVLWVWNKFSNDMQDWGNIKGWHRTMLCHLSWSFWSWFGQSVLWRFRKFSFQITRIISNLISLTTSANIQTVNVYQTLQLRFLCRYPWYIQVYTSDGYILMWTCCHPSNLKLFKIFEYIFLCINSKIYWFLWNCI